MTDVQNYDNDLDDDHFDDDDNLVPHNPSKPLSLIQLMIINMNKDLSKNYKMQLWNKF